VASCGQLAVCMQDTGCARRYHAWLFTVAASDVTMFSIRWWLASRELPLHSFLVPERGDASLASLEITGAHVLHKCNAQQCPFGSYESPCMLKHAMCHSGSRALHTCMSTPPAAFEVHETWMLPCPVNPINICNADITADTTNHVQKKPCNQLHLVCATIVNERSSDGSPS
jgi:hypothetical protein